MTSPCFSPFIIAEAGVNHEGSIDTAKQLIDLAKEGGADAIKFQTYKAELIASKDSPAYWDLSYEKTSTQYQLFKKYDGFWKNEMEALKVYCDKCEIEFMSTPFDFESARFINDLVEKHKISSSDITNKPFLQFLASFGKPIILSTGASDFQEIKNAVDWISIYELPLTLLHCVLNYPTETNNANMARILGLKESFPSCQIGYSDHTMPGDMLNLISSLFLGAKVIEKHFTHDKTLPGNDHYHAMNIGDLKLFKQKISHLQSVYGNSAVVYGENEISARNNARRSIVSKRKIPNTRAITVDDLTFKRPAHGIPPYEIDALVGKFLLNSIDEDVVIKWDHIK